MPDLTPDDLTRGGEGTHWADCHLSHWDCRLAWLERKVEEQAAALERLRAGVYEAASSLNPADAYDRLLALLSETGDKDAVQ